MSMNVSGTLFEKDKRQKCSTTLYTIYYKIQKKSDHVERNTRILRNLVLILEVWKIIAVPWFRCIFKYIYAMNFLLITLWNLLNYKLSSYILKHARQSFQIYKTLHFKSFFIALMALIQIKSYED